MIKQTKVMDFGAERVPTSYWLCRGPFRFTALIFCTAATWKFYFANPNMKFNPTIIKWIHYTEQALLCIL